MPAPPADPLARARSLLPDLPADAGHEAALSALLDRFGAVESRMSTVEQALEVVSDSLLRYAAGDQVDELDEATGVELVDAITLGMNMMVEELRYRTDEIERERENAEAANRAKSAFLANMSHELRTPLNAVIGYSELIADEASDRGLDAIATDSTRVITAAGHLLRLINDILDLSKVEAGHTDLLMEPVTLDSLVREVAETARPLVESNANELVVEGDAIPMMSDPTKLRQVLLNLISNAAKFTRRGRIRVVLESDDAHATVRVIDNGTGIPPDRLSAIFEPFTQAEAHTSRRYGGTGLGLAISQRFCEMLGGSIEVTSQVGEGSTFVVRLPRRWPPVGHTHSARVEQPPVEPGARVVLVVDDDETVFELVSRHIADLDCTVIWAASGAEALELARARRPSAVTLDVLMNGMNGWETLAQFKEDPHLADIPVIMMSILDEQGRGFALGADDYLVKPVQGERLLRAVAAQLHGGRRRVLVVDDEASAREVARRVLTGAGYLVDEVANGRDALRYLGERRPDLILLDLLMPELDGFGVVAHMADDRVLASIPLVVLTAKQLTQPDLDRLRIGVRSILPKGILSEQLLARIAAAVN